MLHLDIPLKYRKQLKFKIDDWFLVKNAEKSENTCMAWVVIKYQSNCRLEETAVRTIVERTATKDSASKNKFIERVRDLSKDLKSHEKMGFNHLEEVEKKIRDRRRKGTAQAQAISSPTKDRPEALLSRTLTNKKIEDLGLRKTSRSPDRFDITLARGVTPDDLYGSIYQKSSPNKHGHDMSSSEVNGKMAKEYAALQEELRKLRARCTALEEGQMSVDNIQLAKQLERERSEQNSLHLKKQKELFEEERHLKEMQVKLDAKNAALSKDLDHRLSQLNQREKRILEMEKAIDKSETEINAKLSLIAKREEDIKKKEIEVEQKNLGYKQREADLTEYAGELDELKTKLLAERDRIARELANKQMAKEDIEKEIKELEAKQREFEKRDKELKKDQERKIKELNDREDKIKREQNDLKQRNEDFENNKKILEERAKRISAQNEKTENEMVELLTQRNKLASDIRQWMTDRKIMEKDMRDKKDEIEAIKSRLQEEEAEAEEREEELDEREDELEEKAEELRAREQTLLANEEKFASEKRRFVENVMASGGLDKLPPELKKLAENLGINVEELQEEEKRINQRRNQLEKLKQENEDNMQKVKAAQEERRMSRRASQQMTNTLMQRFGGGPDKAGASPETAEMRELMKKRIMVKDPTNDDNIEYVGSSIM